MGVILPIYHIYRPVYPASRPVYICILLYQLHIHLVGYRDGWRVRCQPYRLRNAGVSPRGRGGGTEDHSGRIKHPSNVESTCNRKLLMYSEVAFLIDTIIALSYVPEGRKLEESTWRNRKRRRKNLALQYAAAPDLLLIISAPPRPFTPLNTLPLPSSHPTPPLLVPPHRSL